MRKLSTESKNFYFKTFKNVKFIYKNKKFNIKELINLYENNKIEEKDLSELLLKKSQEELDQAFKNLEKNTGVYTTTEIKEKMKRRFEKNDVIIYLEKKYKEYIDEKLLKETIENLQKLGLKKIVIADGQELFPTHRPELGYINIYIKDPNDINKPIIINSNYITKINFKELKEILKKDLNTSSLELNL